MFSLDKTECRARETEEICGQTEREGKHLGKIVFFLALS